MKTYAFLLLTLVALTPTPKKKITVWLCGDSTMSIKEVKAYPETGWGMPFTYFFDSTVSVRNLAKNGRSTKTFISENLWKTVMDNAGEGDYVFIQFGHNDEVKEKVNTYTTPEEYKTNLQRFVNEARQRKAIPILLTSVSRRKFENEKQVETHAHYSTLVREVATATDVTFFDIDTKSRELYQQFGSETSKWLFLQLQPGEHPNYPAGKVDNTHFNELGARLIAELVLKEIRDAKLELAERIVVPVKK